jgi:hypothetical protein
MMEIKKFMRVLHFPHGRDDELEQNKRDRFHFPSQGAINRPLRTCLRFARPRGDSSLSCLCCGNASSRGYASIHTILLKLIVAHLLRQICLLFSGSLPQLFFYLKKVSRLVAAGLARPRINEAAKVITIRAAVVRVIDVLRPMGVVR